MNLATKKMNRELVHTPDGVRDIYGRECSDRSTVKHRIKEIMKRFGYSNITTPTFEFFEVFAKEISQENSKDLYKFFDNDGSTIVLRPDFTPSVARCIAKYFMENDDPVRICYSGNTFTNNHRLQGKMSEHTQLGAELMCDGSVYADAEIIAMMIQSLEETVLKDFQVTIGEADYYRGICEEAKIDEATEIELRDAISGKNYFAAEKILIDAGVEDKYINILLNSPDFAKANELDNALINVNNKRSSSAIAHLKSLYQKLKIYGVEKYISFDLSMLSPLNYYTGVMFRAYTYGVGDAIATGGRYDTLLSKFGKDAPAIGFMVDLEYLMKALYSQKINIPFAEGHQTLYFTDDNYEEILQKARKLRNAGYYVALEKISES